MSDSEFWQSTPYLTKLFVEGAVERERRGYQTAMFTAWHSGLYFRIKRMPPLSKAMQALEGPQKTRRMSQEEMLSVIEQWTVAFGGEDRRRAN